MRKSDTDGKRDHSDETNALGSPQDAAAMQANERTLLAWIRVRRQPVPTNVTLVLLMATAIALLGALLGAFVILSLREH